MTDLATLLPRIERLLDRLDGPAALSGLDWNKVRAARWAAQTRELKPILHPQRVALKDLLAIDAQKQQWGPTRASSWPANPPTTYC